MASGDAELRCSLANCFEPATGKGCHWDGALCAAHLKRDSDRFKESYYAYRQSTIDEPMKKVAKFIDLTRGALFELTSDRADVTDMFDAILESVQRCRQEVVGRLDSKIDAMEGNLKSWHFFEKLKVEISEAETAGDLVKSFQLSKKMQLSLEDAPMSEDWVDPVDNSVEMVKKLQEAVLELTTNAEDAECQNWKAKFDAAVPKVTYHNYMTPTGLFPSVCDHTNGFYYSNQLVSKTAQNGFQSFPPACIFVAWNYNGNCYYTFYNMTFAVLTQRYAPDNGNILVSAKCVNHLQQIFLMTSNKSLTVIDLAGTELQKINDLQLESPKAMTHDMEKLYILCDAAVACFSVKTLELQDTINLPRSSSDASSMTMSGRNLILTSTTSVHRMSIATKRCVKLLHSKGSELQCTIDIGSSIVLVCDLTGKIVALNNNGRTIKEINLGNIGTNYFKLCGACGVVQVCQGFRACAINNRVQCCLYNWLKMSCGHHQLVSATLF